MFDQMNIGSYKKEKKSVKPPMLTDLVYQHILTSIIDCTLMPGQRVVQDDLAASLGVSRAPVSHALQLLKYHGMLQEAGGKGLEVAPIEPNRLRDRRRSQARVRAEKPGSVYDAVVARWAQRFKVTTAA